MKEIAELMNSLREELDYSFDYVIGISKLDLNEDGDTEITRMGVCTYDLMEIYEEMDETFRDIVYENFRKSYPLKVFHTDIGNSKRLVEIGIPPYSLN